MGIGEAAKGLFKQKAGKLLDDDKLEAEGRAQRSKGTEQTRETEDRIKSQAHDKKAEALDAVQERVEER